MIDTIKVAHTKAVIQMGHFPRVDSGFLHKWRRVLSLKLVYIRELVYPVKLGMVLLSSHPLK